MNEVVFQRAALENFLLKAIGVAAVLGALLGWFLPRTVWRVSAGTVTLGDFALVCLLGLISWALTSRLDLDFAGGAAVAAGWLGVFAVREVVWRFSSPGLSIFYGVAVLVLVVTLLGSFFYELRGGRSRTSLLTPGRVLGVLVGAVVLVWLVLATLVGWLIV